MPLVSGLLMRASAVFSVTLAAFTGNAGAGPMHEVSAAVERSCARAEIAAIHVSFGFSSATAGLQFTEEASPASIPDGASSIDCQALFTRSSTAQLEVESHDRSQLEPDSAVLSIPGGVFESATTDIAESDAALDACLDDGQAPVYAIRETFYLKGLGGVPSFKETRTDQIFVEPPQVSDCASNTRDQQSIGGDLSTGLVQLGPKVLPIRPINPRSSMTLAESAVATEKGDTFFGLYVHYLSLRLHRYVRRGPCGHNFNGNEVQVAIYSLKGVFDKSCTRGANGKYKTYLEPYKTIDAPSLRGMNFSRALTRIGDLVATSLGVSRAAHGRPTFYVGRLLSHSRIAAECHAAYARNPHAKGRQLRSATIYRRSDNHLSYMLSWY